VVRVTDLRFGQEAPGFSLPSSAGGQTALSDFKGKSDVVLVFYCYDWGSI
jgi:peroxiredoxin